MLQAGMMNELTPISSPTRVLQIPAGNYLKKTVAQAQAKALATVGPETLGSRVHAERLPLCEQH
jgi:hypothetical protein